MKLKGDLKTHKPAELFEQLCRQRVSGTLVFRCGAGEKRFAFTGGQAAVGLDHLAERIRLGEQLVAHGVMSREKLDAALRLQKTRQPPARLGELLVEQGCLEREAVRAELRFQLEEELCELFTWGEASFEFDDEGPFAAAGQEAAGGAAAARLYRFDLLPIVSAAGQRGEEWEKIAERLPSPYLCFRVTPKGEEHCAGASEALQRLLRLIREGRTLENVLKLSLLGRFSVSQTVLRLLDEGWIAPYPGADLPKLAEEHRLRSRYGDALGIYRRLLTSAEDEAQREKLEELVAECGTALRRERAAEEREAAAPAGSAAPPGRRLRLPSGDRGWIIVGAMGALLLLLLGVLLYPHTFGSRVALPPDYLQKVQQTEEALAKERFEEAIAIWAGVVEAVGPRDDELGQHVYEKLTVLCQKYLAHLQALITQAQLSLNAGRLDDAEAAFRRIERDHPGNPLAEQVEQGLAQVALRRAEQARQAELTEWQQRLAEARALEEQRKYELARVAYETASEGAPAGSPARLAAEQGLARLAEVREHNGQLLAAGVRFVQAAKIEEALGSFDAAYAEWPELPSARKAREHSVSLRMRLARLHEELAAAQTAAERGDKRGAREILQRVVAEYGEFAEARAAKPRLDELETAARGAEELLARAENTEKAGRLDEARPLFETLLREHRAFLAAKPFRFPMHVACIPPGAVVRLNGKEQGRAPLRVEAPLDGELTLRFELAGFEPREQEFKRVSADLLSFSVRLERAALRRLEVGGASLAPPLVSQRRLYVAAGATLVAFDETAARELWRTARLCHAAVAAQEWSLPEAPAAPADASALRAAPLQLDAERLLVTTPDGEVLEVRAANGQHRTCFKLPSPPLGDPLLVPGKGPAGPPLLAFACADGQARVYEAGGAAELKWAAPLGGGPDAKRISPARLLGVAGGRLVAASRGGAIAAWEVRSGQGAWSSNADGELAWAAAGAAPGAADVAVLAMASGNAVGMDLAAGAKLWERARAAVGGGVATVAAGAEGFFLLMRDGTLVNVPRAAPADATPAWEKTLDGPGLPPLPAGTQVFAATFGGTLYAISVADGKERWRFRCAGRPTHIAVAGRYLYVVTAEGRLGVLEAELPAAPP